MPFIIGHHDIYASFAADFFCACPTVLFDVVGCSRSSIRWPNVGLSIERQPMFDLSLSCITAFSPFSDEALNVSFFIEQFFPTPNVVYTVTA